MFEIVTRMNTPLSLEDTYEKAMARVAEYEKGLLQPLGPFNVIEVVANKPYDYKAAVAIPLQNTVNIPFIGNIPRTLYVEVPQDRATNRLRFSVHRRLPIDGNAPRLPMADLISTAKEEGAFALNVVDPKGKETRFVHGKSRHANMYPDLTLPNMAGRWMVFVCYLYPGCCQADIGCLITN